MEESQPLDEAAVLLGLANGEKELVCDRQRTAVLPLPHSAQASAQPLLRLACVWTLAIALYSLPATHITSQASHFPLAPVLSLQALHVTSPLGMALPLLQLPSLEAAL